MSERDHLFLSVRWTTFLFHMLSIYKKRKRPKRRNVFNDGHFLSLMCVAIIRRFPSHGLLKRNHVTVKDNLADRSTRSALQEHQPGLTDGYKWFPLPFPSLVSYSCGLSSSVLQGLAHNCLTNCEGNAWWLRTGCMWPVSSGDSNDGHIRFRRAIMSWTNGIWWCVSWGDRSSRPFLLIGVASASSSRATNKKGKGERSAAAGVLKTHRSQLNVHPQIECGYRLRLESKTYFFLFLKKEKRNCLDDPPAVQHLFSLSFTFIFIQLRENKRWRKENQVSAAIDNPVIIKFWTLGGTCNLLRRFIKQVHVIVLLESQLI